MTETRPTLHPEYLLGHSHMPRPMVFEFFGDQRDATRLEIDMRRARLFALANPNSVKETR